MPPGKMHKSADARGSGPSRTDSRFAAIYSDPRFRRFPKAAKQIEVDERFSGMFSDPRFQAPSRVDKRGRKVKKQSKGENMRKFYHLKDEDDWAQDAAEVQSTDILLKGKRASVLAASNPSPGEHDAAVAAELEEDSGPAELASSSSEDEAAGADQKAKERWARLRGLAGPQSSSSESDDDERDKHAALEEESDDPDQALAAEFGVGALAANPDEHIPDGQESARLAIVDLDWDRIRAVDILVVLSSFLRRPQAIQAVTIYPSNFGQQRMKEEASMGPRLGPAHPKHRQTRPEAAHPASDDLDAAQLSSEDDDVHSSASSEDDEAHELSSDDAEALLEGESLSSDEDAVSSSDEEEGAGGQDAAASSDAEASVSSGDEAVQRRLAVYERSRLRYFYAIVECDSPATGAQLYRECDGLEFERSANKLDLRFVPAEQSFAERVVHDRAASIPAGYAAPDFATKVLQHTRVQLTWDADDEARKKALGRKVNAEQLREDDFKAYMGSSDEEEEQEEEEEEEGNRKGSAAAPADAAKLKQLLQQAGNPARRAGGKTWGAAVDSESEELGDEQSLAGRRSSYQAAATRDVDMQVTFTGGLEGLSERLAARKKDKNATVWDKYLQHQREKKRQAKQTGRRRGDDSDADDSADEYRPVQAADPFFVPEADPFKDPFFQDDEGGAEAAEPSAPPERGQKSRKPPAADAADPQPADDKAARKQAAKAERQRQAQLELLMMDDSALQDAARLGGAKIASGSLPHSMAKASRKQRIRDKREARKQDRTAGSDDDDAQQRTGAEFKVNVEDPRFKSLFTSHHFALDPTDPRFTSSSAAASINAEITRRTADDAAGTLGNGAAKHLQTPLQPNGLTGGQQPDKLNVMVAGLKRKATAMEQMQKQAKYAQFNRVAKSMKNTRTKSA